MHTAPTHTKKASPPVVFRLPSASWASMVKAAAHPVVQKRSPSPDTMEYSAAGRLSPAASFLLMAAAIGAFDHPVCSPKAIGGAESAHSHQLLGIELTFSQLLMYP